MAATATPAPTSAPAWTSLALPPAELALPFTLPTGQSFRWRADGGGGYVGVVGGRVVHVRERGGGGAAYRVLARAPSAPPPSTDAGALADYFQTGVRLAPREAAWAAADPGRYAAVARAVRGARVLRQDPLECLISFILSSNNNIARIASLVERVAGLYGDPILPADALPALAGLTAPPPPVGALPHASHAWHAFPTLAQLAAADEGALRGAGLGYRARYVVGTAAALASKPGGGEAWLAGLRSEDVPTRDAAAALATLPGVGPKVAACVCLFALDKRDAVPVDTHVWQLAAKHYVPSLRGKTFTPALAERVVDALVGVFGPDAGWAHNALFIAELPSTRAALAAAGAGGGDGSESGESDGDSESEASSDGGKDADDDALALGPVTPAERAKRRRRT